MLARRFTAMARSSSMTLNVASRPLAGTPALETRTSTSPASRARRSASPSREKSATMTRASPSSSARRSSAALLRAESTNFAPASCSRRAMCGPRPVDAPVRRTVFPRRSSIGRRIPRARLGRLSHEPRRAVAFLAQLELRFQRFSDRALGDQAALDVGTGWDLEHRVEQRLFDDRLQSARTGAPKQGQLSDRIERSLLEHELDIVQREELLVLLDQGVLGLGEDAHDVLLVKVVQRDDDRQAADELGDESVLQEVLRLQLLERLRHRLALDLVMWRPEPDRAPADALLDNLLQPVERAAADEQDVGGVDLDEILVRVLAAALRRNVGHRALEDLEQGLLNTFAADIARDRRVVRLARDLVDLVDVDDSALRAADVEVGGLDQAKQDVLHVLAHVTGLGEARRVGDRERDVEDLRQRLREVGLAAARRANQQHVRLAQLDVADGLRGGDSRVVVVDLDGEDLLRAVLADHVLVESGADGFRIGDEAGLLLLGARRPVVVLEYFLAQVDALVADEDARARDQLAYLVLPLSAEGAARVAASIFSFVHRCFPVSIKKRPAPGDYGPTESRWQG